MLPKFNFFLLDFLLAINLNPLITYNKMKKAQKINNLTAPVFYFQYQPRFQLVV